ncbi:MAG: endonuclease [Candidatus Aenigmarchaeota archaeon]|nr:endonuclease [Candidatus Aenigmarchaeota archaeon]
MARRTASLHKEYEKLLKEYGPQAWWPMRRGFAPKEWEVCVGAILTQNTNWRNVEKALDNLIKSNVVTPEATLKISSRRLEQLVRPSGFYRQKAIRLKTLAQFILSYGSFNDFKRIERHELLKVKGVGPETCDSILLYACGRPYFVIDSYTKRFVRSLGMEPANYEALRAHFESRLPKDVALYKEFHALIVEWGKRKTRTKL